MELLHYCAEKADAQRPGFRPSFRMIEQEAFHWANLEILTFEQAEAYIRRQRDRSSALGRIQALLGLQGRALTKPERDNILDWLDMGFADDAIQLAYERTVYKTGRLAWPYMSKILKRWHGDGLHDRKSIEAKEGSRPASNRSAPASGNEEPVDVDRLKELLDKFNRK